jgi:hypothetical protein
MTLSSVSPEVYRKYVLWSQNRFPSGSLDQSTRDGKRQKERTPLAKPIQAIIQFVETAASLTVSSRERSQNGGTSSHSENRIVTILGKTLFNPYAICCIARP